MTKKGFGNVSEIAQLRVGQYRLQFEALEPLRLPNYSGSTWRGVFGHALKSLVCVTRQKSCEGCLLYRSCVYSYLFETPPPLGSEKLANYSAVPHPYLFTPSAESELQAGQPYSLGLTLFGNGNRHLPYVIHALQQASKKGIGRDKGKLKLLSVSQQDEQQHEQVIYQTGGELHPLPPFLARVPAVPQRLRINLKTPLRLRVNHQNIHPDQLNFSHFFGSLMRRLSSLSYFHHDEVLELDFAALKKQAETVTFVASELSWHEWRRYSNRQNGWVPMGGVVGWFELESVHLAAFWPHLSLGEWAHNGKGSCMGLGRYELDVIEP